MTAAFGREDATVTKHAQWRENTLGEFPVDAAMFTTH
jgi:hypothetical protein